MMSVTTHDCSEHTARLRQLATSDPTRTGELRARFRRDIRRRFRAVRGAIRRVVGYDEDYFRLRQDARLADDTPDEGLTQAERRRQFRRWLRQQFRDRVLEPTRRRALREGQHWTATYVRAAYGSGWERATQRLQQAGLAPSTVEDVFRLPTPRRQLRDLYTRVYGLVEDTSRAAALQVADAVTTGLAEGINPREMARRATAEARGVQRTRAEVIARTETIRAHSEATLDRYERARVGGVTVSGEFTTADDARVCPICEHIAGDAFTPRAMRDATVAFEPSDSEPDHLAGEYPVMPPVHPQCRCAILPVVD